MATYKELQDKIAALQKQAEEQRNAEVGGAIQKIQALMAEYGITAGDLAFTGRKGSGKSGKRVLNVQFRDKEGNTWSGLGRKPAWLQGKDKEEFRV